MAIVTVTRDDNNGTVLVSAGDEIVLRLPENPTTGYRWGIEPTGGSLVEEGSEYRPEEPARVGSGGVREIRFRAATPGIVRLALKRWQPWEGEESVTERFAVEVEIQG